MSEEMDGRTAREALRDAEAKRAAAAGRVKTPWWYELVWSVVVGGVVLSMAAPQPFQIMLIVLFLVALGVIVSIYRKRYGVWVSGYRPGRTRTIAVSFSAVLVGIMIGAWIAHHVYGATRLLWLGGIVAVVVGFITSRLWTAAYRAEAGGGS